MATTSAGNENDSAEAAQMRLEIVNPAEEAEVETCLEVVAGLRQLVNNRDYSDVVFFCNDGKEVRASRIHLAARSDMLKSMLTNAMAESNRDEIKLPEVSSPVMLSVLEFLYTGSLLDYPLQSWKMGWDVLIASGFFLLPKLEIIVRKFMHAEIVSVAQDLPGAATLLTEGVGFKVFQTDDNLRELVTILSSNWSDSDFVQNLSEDALHYLLANSRCQDDDILSFREYLRFRQVIQWWVYQLSTSMAPKALMGLLVPDKATVMSIRGHPANRDKKHMVRILCDGPDEALKIAAIRLLSNIDYKLIHPTILAKVVEPLKISPEKILNALRFHNLCRPFSFKMLKYDWYHGQSYTTFEHGHVIYRTGKTIGLAVIWEPISSWRGVYVPVYEWQLVLDEGCSLFAELGFVSDLWYDKLDNKKLSDLNVSHVLKSNGKETKVKRGGTWEVLQVQPFYAGSRVSFIFDTSRNTCCICINGRDFPKVWKGLSYATYFPAVSFGNCRQGRIRVELVRGFDICRSLKPGRKEMALHYVP